MPITHTTRSLTTEAARTERRWYVADADGQVLGRLATRIAMVLRGKHKPSFSPHLDAGDFVIVINAKGVRLTGHKLADKTYVRHSGYPGGIRRASAQEVLDKKPTRVIREAVEVTSNGWRMIIRDDSRPKYSSAGRSLTVISPSPARSLTRATEVLRLPVPEKTLVSALIRVRILR